MPPSVALFICTAFVIFLLRLERNQAPDVSHALWIPTIWMLVVMSKPFGVWFHIEGTMEGGSAPDRAFLIILICINFFVLIKRRFDLSSAFRNNPWLMVLLSYMSVSLLWSSIPFISFKRWVRELVAVAAALQLLSEQNPRIAIISLLRRTIYILIPFSLLLIKYYPALGCKYNVWTGGVEWTGVADTKNHLAKLCIIAIFFIIWGIRERRKGSGVSAMKYQIYIELLLLLVAFWLLVGPHRSLSYSATSTIVLFVGILIFVGLLWANKNRNKISFSLISLALGLIVVYGTIVPFIGGLVLWDISEAVGRDATLTDRTSRIWSVLVPLAMRNPLFGHGVGGFWTTVMVERTSINAHNGYLDALLHYGFLGLGLIFLFVLSCARKATITMSEDMDWGILFVCLIVMILIHNITESSIYTFTSGLGAIILLFSVASSKSLPNKPLVP